MSRRCRVRGVFIFATWPDYDITDSQMHECKHTLLASKIMIVRKLRLEKGWSQEQLATLTGLNTRTIQRIERGQTPSLESKRALASVFEIGIEAFNQPITNTETDTTEDDMPLTTTVTPTATATDTSSTSNSNEVPTLDNDEKLAMQYAKSISEFYTHLLFFIIFVPIIAITKGISDPQVWMICGGWTLGIIIHGLVAYEKITLFTPAWERNLVEKKLGRKLKK